MQYHGIFSFLISPLSAEKKGSNKYRGPRRSGWAGAVLGGQGQYWLFHYQKSELEILFNKSALRLVGLDGKIMDLPH